MQIESRTERALRVGERTGRQRPVGMRNEQRDFTVEGGGRKAEEEVR